MTINLNLYIVNLPVIKAFVEANPDVPTRELIQRATILTSVPIIVAAYFIAEVRGFDDDVKMTIASVTEFYNYDGVVPLKKDVDKSN